MNNQKIGRIYSEETFGTVDGPGIRYVLFLQGCPLRCLYCHNPDSLSMNGGKEITTEEAVREILRYKPFIRSGGVTFSGGEPLVQAEFVLEATHLLHEQGIHVAIDTSGCMPISGSVREAIDEADMLLLDIKSIDSQASKELTGQTNERALDTLEYCEKTGKPVWIRHVLLRGYTLDDASLRKLAQKLKGYRCVQRVELLPFHKLGEPKWDGREYKLKDVGTTTKKETEHAKQFFTEAGLTVQ